ncbi:penicillin-binding protein [Neobacillus cucumis]|uniref:penicillin-binding protein n=1 Tax=Neobacillus cucumis TaxID=1740721 RepID=UPI0018E046EE|nr:penicillin-binding transpeptidase domain-containing protein [Neobacillus cucumis]MBI0578394.1 penicillin-binding protein [Neobacillus cucumis]
MIKKQPYMNVGAACLFGIFGLLFFILLFRYFSIEISGEAAGQPLAAKAQKKYTRVGTLEASRGIIYDRNGEVVAEDTASYSLLAILSKKVTTDPKHPNNVTDPRYTAEQLAKYIDMDESEIYKILDQPKKFQVEFGRAGKDISIETKRKIEALKLPGITFIPQMKRFYPNGVFASHLVGYADPDQKKDNKIVGQMGIEKSLNDYLTGTNGKINYESDLWGYILPDKKENITPAKDGDDVYLTIDQKIQTFLEDAMNKVVKEYNPKKIIAIVADPKTGDILAMGQRPSFDPKTKEGITDSWHNEAIETSYEPGSTMKIFTLAAAVNEGVFNPNELYKSGSYQVSPRSPAIHDHNYSGWGTISFLEGLQRSSNVAFAKIAHEKLGFEKFREYLSKFGFDKPTGIDLPNETSGKIMFNYPIEKVTTSFGQGTAITPIEQIQAATAVANDGKMMKPHVIDKIVNHDTKKTIKETKPEVVSTPITAQTAKTVRDYLETVVTSKNGTGRRYKIDGYSVAGKTGTANIPNPNGAGYLTGSENYIFSFLGMAPKNDPKLIVYVAVQQPQIDNYELGSRPVSEIFKPVMKNSLQYLNIRPSKLQKPSSIKLGNFTGDAITETVKNLKNQGFSPIVIGKGPDVTTQLPKAGTTILEGERVLLGTKGMMTAPDMTGWSLRDVMQLAKIANLKFNVAGSGYVVKQNISPGATLKKGDNLIVQLQTPEQQSINTEDASQEKNSDQNISD